MAVAAQMAFAASDAAPPSRAPGKGATSSTPHHGAGAPRHRHTARPAQHQATTHKEHNKEIAGRPATGTPAAPVDKSLDRRSLVGPFSLGVETEQNVKRRSIRGGDYDPDRDGEESKVLPPFLGFSLKAPLSW